MADLSKSTILRRAQAALRARQHVPAEQLCQAALRSDGKSSEAHVMLSQICYETSRHEEAIEHMQQAVKLAPRNVQPLVYLGQLLTLLGDFRKAMLQYDKALRLQPKHPAALAGKATVYERQDKYDKARKVLEKALALDPVPPEALAVYMRVMMHENEHAEAVRAGQRLYERPQPPTLGARDAWFALAKACEKHGDFEQALGAASRAHAVNPAPFDLAQFERSVDALIAFFTRERIESAPRPRVRDDRPIFVVGRPRSGSTLTERILDAHPDVHGAGELTTMTRLTQDMQMRVASTLGYPACVGDADEDDLDGLARAYLDELERDAGEALRIVDKNLGNHAHLGLIAILFPEARVIHTLRDPLDNCISCHLERLPTSTVPYASSLELLGRTYRHYARLMDHWREVLPIPMLEVRYEDVVADQEGKSREIVEFAGLPWDEACLRFYEKKRVDTTLSYDQVRRPIYRSSVSRAARYGDLLDPLREALGDCAPSSA